MKWRRVVLFLLGLVVSLGLLTGLWSVSPGPAWMARITALRYAEKVDPAYISAIVLEGTVSARLTPFPFEVEYPSWVVGLTRSEEEWENFLPDGRILRLVLNGGLFPSRVEGATWIYADRVEPVVPAP